MSIPDPPLLVIIAASFSLVVFSVSAAFKILEVGDWFDFVVYFLGMVFKFFAYVGLLIIATWVVKYSLETFDSSTKKPWQANYSCPSGSERVPVEMPDNSTIEFECMAQARAILGTKGKGSFAVKLPDGSYKHFKDREKAEDFKRSLEKSR